MRYVYKLVRRIQKLCACVSELTGWEMDVGRGCVQMEMETGTGGGGGLMESWMGRGGTEDQRGGRGECVLRTIPSVFFGPQRKEGRSVAQQMNRISFGIWWLFILGRGEVMSCD